MDYFYTHDGNHIFQDNIEYANQMFVYGGYAFHLRKQKYLVSACEEKSDLKKSLGI